MYPNPRRKLVIEEIDPDMVNVYRSKTPAQRLRIASDMYTGARRLLLSHLRHQHPDWSSSRLISGR